MITLQECKELFESSYGDETLDFLQNGINDLDFSDLIEDYQMILSKMDVKFEIGELIGVGVIIYVEDNNSMITQIGTMEFVYDSIESFYDMMGEYDLKAKLELHYFKVIQ